MTAEYNVITDTDDGEMWKGRGGQTEHMKCWSECASNGESLGRGSQVSTRSIVMTRGRRGASDDGVAY